MDLREMQLAYLDIPPITRAYSTACVLTTALVHFDVITPYKLYFSPKLIFDKNHWWRFFSPFCYFGPIGFPFLFNMIFTYRYCRMLEESSFRNKAVDMVVMFVFGGLLMLFAASYLDMLFLGQAFTIMLVYVWSRRNPQIRMNFFGVLNFSAPYLPWVLLAFSFLLGNSIEVDAVGIAVGHAYYFLEDVFPHQVCGFRLLNVRALARLFANESNERDGNTTNENDNDAPLRDDVPRAAGLGWNAQEG